MGFASLLVRMSTEFSDRRSQQHEDVSALQPHVLGAREGGATKSTQPRGRPGSRAGCRGGQQGWAVSGACSVAAWGGRAEGKGGGGPAAPAAPAGCSVRAQSPSGPAKPGCLLPAGVTLPGSLGHPSVPGPTCPPDRGRPALAPGEGVPGSTHTSGSPRPAALPTSV